MKIAIISDVHAKWQKLQIPECDVLISCGDYSFRGEKHIVKNFHEWLNEQEVGHIHCSAGETEFMGVKYINAAICDEMYMPTNPIRIFEL